MRKFHLTMMVVWASLVIPTILFWRESILWVAFMSIYACFGMHMESYHTIREGRR